MEGTPLHPDAKQYLVRLSNENYGNHDVYATRIEYTPLGTVIFYSKKHGETSERIEAIYKEFHSIVFNDDI